MVAMLRLILSMSSDRMATFDTYPEFRVKLIQYRRARGKGTEMAAFGEPSDPERLNPRTNQFANNFHPLEERKLKVTHC